MAIYVDYILITEDATDEIKSLKDFLHTEFKIKDLGLLHYFLGMEILREEQGMIISQRKYTMELLEEFDVSHISSVSSPMDPSVKLSVNSGMPISDPTIYRHLIGKINYLTHTRPDLSFAVLTLSQFMQNPTDEHFNSGLRVIRYLKRFPSQGLFFTTSPSLSVNTFCDVDWASCRDSRRSVSGFFISLGGSPISILLTDLSITSHLPVPIHSDSRVAIHIARNPVFHERTKHVELDCHFVHQQYLVGLISLSFVPSKEQLADIFTKPLAGPSHHQSICKLGLTLFPSNLRGDVEVTIPSSLTSVEKCRDER